MPLTLTSIALTSLLAQAPAVPPRPASVTMTLGSGQTWDDEGKVGNGAALGATFTYRFHRRWSVDGSVERLAHRRDTTALIFSGRTIFTTIGAAYHFSDAGIAPYVGGGFGGAFYKGEFADTILALSRGRSSQSTAAYGNAGVLVPIGERFVVAPDFRLTICQAQDDFAPWSTLRFAVKAGVRF